MAHRELKITYGSYVCGHGQGKRHIDGPIRIRDGSDDFEASFTLVICGTTSASDFSTEWEAARAELRKPNQEFKIELVNATSSSLEATWLSAKPTTSSRTALNVAADFEMPAEQEGQSARSAAIEVTVTGERLADYDSGHSRQDFSYEVLYPASRRREVVFRGSFTATASAASLATYEAEIAADVLTVATALGGTWPTVPSSEKTTTDKEDHVTRFERAYKEILANESVGTANDTSINNQEMAIEVTRFGAEGTDRDRPLLQVNVGYRADIDNVQTTELASTWIGKILPLIKQNMRDFTGSTIYLTRQAPTYDPVNNVITARVEGWSRDGGDQLLRTVRTTDDIEFNWIFRETWSDVDSSDDPTPAYAYPASKVVTRTIETTTRTLGAIPAANIGGGGGAGGDRISFGSIGGGAIRVGAGSSAASVSSGTNRRAGGQAIPSLGILGPAYLIRRRRGHLARVLGHPTDNIRDRTDLTVTEVFRIVKKPPVSSGGGAGGKVGSGTEKKRT